jgi:lactoylglutathione lyase
MDIYEPALTERTEDALNQPRNRFRLVADLDADNAPDYLFSGAALYMVKKACNNTKPLVANIPVNNNRGMFMAKAIHSMIRVRDLEKSIDYYDKAFNLKVADKFDFDDFTLAYLRNDENDFEIELTLNKGRLEAYTHGDGYGHVAVCVNDVPAEHKRFVALGLAATDVKEFHRDGSLMARFFFVQDPDGYKIEVLERHGRYQ